MESEITLCIHLIKPTPGVVFGLQKGSGSVYETIQKQIPTSNDLSFTFTIKIKGERPKDKLPKLSGSFVQGPADGKFVYIGKKGYYFIIFIVTSLVIKAKCS